MIPLHLLGKHCALVCSMISGTWSKSNMDRRVSDWGKTDAAVQTHSNKHSRTHNCRDNKHSLNPLGDYKSTYSGSTWLCQLQIPHWSCRPSTLSTMNSQVFFFCTAWSMCMKSNTCTYWPQCIMAFLLYMRDTDAETCLLSWASVLFKVL